MTNNILKIVALSALGLSLASYAVTFADSTPNSAPSTQPYPLDTCVVSGEKLGEMGKPIIFQYEGREIQFCCPSCKKTFLKDPAKYLKKLDDATTKPSK